MNTAEVYVHHSIMCSCCCQMQKGKKMETWTNEVIFLPTHNLRLRWCQVSQAKQGLNDSNISEEKIQWKPIFIKKCFFWFKRQHPYSKVWNKSRLCVIHGYRFGFHRMGKNCLKAVLSLPCQTTPEGIIRLVTFTLKIFNFLLNHKKSYWSSNCCNFWDLSIISTKLWIIHE